MSTKKRNVVGILIALAVIIITPLLWITWEDLFGNPSAAEMIHNSPLILLALPTKNATAPLFEVKSTLKGTIPPSQSYTNIRWHPNTSASQNQPGALILFLQPRYIIAGPLQVSRINAVYDDKVYGMSLKDFSALCSANN